MLETERQYPPALHNKAAVLADRLNRPADAVAVLDQAIRTTRSRRSCGPGAGRVPGPPRPPGGRPHGRGRGPATERWARRSATRSPGSTPSTSREHPEDRAGGAAAVGRGSGRITGSSSSTRTRSWPPFGICRSSKSWWRPPCAWRPPVSTTLVAHRPAPRGPQHESAPALSVDLLEDRTTPVVWNNPWPDPGHLTLSFAPDGTDVQGSPSALFADLNAQGPNWQTEILRVPDVGGPDEHQSEPGVGRDGHPVRHPRAGPGRDRARGHPDRGHGPGARRAGHFHPVRPVRRVGRHRARQHLARFPTGRETIAPPP